jgi:hypothetical protein
VETVESIIIPICEHIKPSGQRCGSPAMKGRNRCFYHEDLERSLPADRNLYTGFNINAQPGEWPTYSFPVPPMEDAAAIQTAFMVILHGIAIDAVPLKKARAMLSAIHGAAANLRQMNECFAQCQAKIGKKPPASEKNAKAPAKRTA